VVLQFTITVVSASIGDVVYVKNGVYRETLPLRVPAGVTVQGESLRGTEIRPASGTGHQVKTITVISGGTGGTPGTYNYIHGSTTSSNGIASSFVANVVTDGSSTPTVTIYHGGTGF
jgi:pectin methylesterase-like acyl-CoA thioesterase